MCNPGDLEAGVVGLTVLHGMYRPDIAVVGSGFSSISDENLLQQLAGDNLELRKEPQKLLGKDSFDEPAKPEPAPAAVPNNVTKH